MEIPFNLISNLKRLSLKGLFLLIAQPTYAYLDPGSGSFILQIVLGVVLGGLFTIKVYWQKVKTFFIKIFKRTGAKDKHDKKNQ